MGAKVYVCPAHVSADDPRSYYEVAKRLHQETPNSIYINQYFNDLNIETSGVYLLKAKTDRVSFQPVSVVKMEGLDSEELLKPDEGDQL